MENPRNRVRVATAGEALIDLVRRPDGMLAPCAGGAVYNFTRALALQGVATAYLNPLSRDPFGRLLARGLEAAGVAQARGDLVPEPTSLAVVGVDTAGQPAYTFYREGVADRAVDADGLIAATRALPGLEAVCTGCLALAPQDRQRYLPWLQDSRQCGLMVVVDANLRPSAVADTPGYRASVRAALALADVIKVSDEDLAALEPGRPDLLQVARGLFALGPAFCVALTRGAEGALLLARDGRVWQASERSVLHIEDTVGAGDSFLAGLVAGLLGDDARASWRRDGLSTDRAEAALARAVASASHCVQQRGCVPPTQAELQAWLARGSVRVASMHDGKSVAAS
jgi:fructokinase